jgi:hypothetical protein
MDFAGEINAKPFFIPCRTTFHFKVIAPRPAGESRTEGCYTFNSQFLIFNSSFPNDFSFFPGEAENPRRFCA